MSMCPPWLKRVSQDALPMVSLAVDPTNLDHVGIFYRDEDDLPHFLHLAFHHMLKQEAVPTEHHWVASTIPRELQDSVAAWCERVWKRHGAKIPYGFRYDATRFDETGEVVRGPR